MDKIYEQTMLYDFYGELLTEHQRNIYEEALYQDMSLGEIAEEQGISRQGVHDLIKRCDRILQDYESKLHLVERFAKAKKTIGEIEKLTLAEDAIPVGTVASPADVTALRERLDTIRKLSRDLLEEL